MATESLRQIHSQRPLSRVRRLVKILSLLDQDSNTDPRSIMQVLCISRRTFFRDLSVLREAGIEIAYSANQHRYLQNSLNYQLGHSLSDSEAKAIKAWIKDHLSEIPVDNLPLRNGIQKVVDALIMEG